MQYLNNFSHIYLEKRVKNIPFTQEILSKFSDAQIIEIDHYKDKFNSYSQNFRAQKKSQKLILAKKEPPFLYEASDLIQKQDKNFLYTTPMLNCVYDCYYCFLQGMYPSSNIVLFVNLEDFFDEVDRYLEKHKTLFLSISYDTDILAVENLFGVAKKWINFAKKRPLKIEIRTKAVNVDRLPLNENVILSFSLSPDEVISKYEFKTPSLDKRLNAIKKVIARGYKPSITIDPIIKIPNYKKVYKKMIDKIFNEVSPENIESVIFGAFRMNSSQFKKIKNSLVSDLFYYPYEVKNGKVFYKDEKEIIDYFKNILSNYKEKLFYV